MTDKEMRIEIAKDVLLHINVLDVRRGKYMVGDDEESLKKIDPKVNLQDQVGILRESCRVCAARAGCSDQPDRLIANPERGLL